MQLKSPIGAKGRAPREAEVMRRPLPPELVALGDQLELAVRREVGRHPALRRLVSWRPAGAVRPPGELA